MRILLTGGSGFLGSALARHWVDSGHELTLLLRPGSSLSRLSQVSDRCRILRLGSDAEVRAAVALAAPDALVHAACCYGRAGESPWQLFEANLRLGMLLWDALAMQGRRGTTFLNTASVLSPEVSLYALSKWQFSEWGKRMAGSGGQGTRFIDARLQHMYGAGDDPGKFTTHVLHACHKHVDELPLTAGEQRRDFIHIDDVVRAFDTVLTQAAMLEPYAAIDVGSGQAPSIREFVETVHALCQSRTRLQFGALSYRPHEAMHCQADITRLKDLGWRCEHDLRSGLRLTLQQEFAS